MYEKPIAKMHSYLTDMDKYNTPLPVYLESPLSDDDLKQIRKILDDQIAKFGINDQSHPNVLSSRFAPRIMQELSRVVIEFVMPKEIEEKIDSIIKPMYKDEIKMSHYSYLGYDLKYSNNTVPPSLPPHIDSAETLITFNLQFGGNLDWDVCVEDTAYPLKTGDALVFSAVNQVHWRPKRVWKPGEFMEILTINYSPITDWRFTGALDPIDPRLFPDKNREYLMKLSEHPKMRKAWDIYNQTGIDTGINPEFHGIINTEE